MLKKWELKQNPLEHVGFIQRDMCMIYACVHVRRAMHYVHVEWGHLERSRRIPRLSRKSEAVEAGEKVRSVSLNFGRKT